MLVRNSRPGSACAPSTATGLIFAAALVGLTSACTDSSGSTEPEAQQSAPAIMPAETPPALPNVVLIVADDLGYADVSTYGDRVQTPNIDRIGSEGAVFSQGYVTTPVCSPSRAALLTGRYQQRYGFEYNAREAPEVPDVGLIDSELTIADYLRESGYATGMVGKWHLGFKDEHYPTRRGFDEFYGHLAGATSYINARQQGAISLPRRNALQEREPGDLRTDVVVRGDGPQAPPDRPRGTHIERNGMVIEESRYLTDVLGDEARAFINRHADEPFFLYAAFNAPHSPFQTTQTYYDRFPNVPNELQRIYFGMIAALDDAVGRILDTLEARGLTDNTLVIFLSDNGCAGYFPGLCACDPLSGGKLTYYEGGVRVPYLLRWPAVIEPGTRIDTLVSSLDVLPTVLRASGQPTAMNVALDGYDLLDLVSRRGQEALPRERFVWRNYPTVAVRAGDMKLIKPNQDLPGGFLYDLARDPREQEDLAAERPDLVARLEANIDEWRSITVEPGWSRRPPVSYSICNIEPIGFEN